MDVTEAMRVFVTAVDEGSLSGAGRTLGISPALASKYLGQLETRLGTRLLNRTTRALHLTDEGQAYLPRARAVLDDLDELEASVRARLTQPKGILRIAGSRAFGTDRLADAVAAFMHAHPEVIVDLDLHERLVDIVGEGYDVAIRVNEPKDSSFIARRILRYPYYYCASPAYLEAHGRPASVEDLRRHDCIVNRPLSPESIWRFTVDGQRVSVPIKVRAHTNSAHSTASLVRAGLGIGICLHSTVIDDLNAGRLVTLFEEENDYDRSVWAIYPTAKHLSARVRFFVDFLVDYFREV